MKEPNFYALARTYIGERPESVPMWQYNNSVTELAAYLRDLHKTWIYELKVALSNMVDGAAVRDATMQKISKAILEFEL